MTNPQDGECFITTAGKRPYKGIIHVVCPSYQPNPLAASDDPLIFALLKGLQAASNKKYSSIVLPSIGSDGFGYPPEIGAELLVKALNMHFDTTPDSSIRDVIVADMNKFAVKFVYAAAEKSTTQAQNRMAATRMETSTGAVVMPTKDKLGPESNSIATSNGLVVDVVRSNIEQQKVFRAQPHEALGSAKATEVDDPIVTPSLCLEVLGLSRNDLQEAISRVSTELCNREKASISDSRKL